MSLIVAFTAWGIIEYFRTNYADKLITGAERPMLLARLTRDADIVQGVAAVVSVCGTLLVAEDRSSSYALVAVLVGALATVVVIFGMVRVPAGTYFHYSCGPFTPLTVLLVACNGGLWLCFR